MSSTKVTALPKPKYDELCEGQVDTGDDGTDYCNEPATEKIKGEEDSFGVEWIYMCKTHATELYDKLWAAQLVEAELVKNNPCGRCSKKGTGTVIRWHVPDEPSYEQDVFWCKACRDYYRRTLQEEMCGMDYRYARQISARRYKCYCGTHSDFDFDETVTDYVIVDESDDDYW